MNTYKQSGKIYLGSWELKKGQKNITFDATGVIAVDGIYKIHLEYDSHKDGIYVIEAQINANSSLIGKDSHGGSQCACKFHQDKPFYSIPFKTVDFETDVQLNLRFETKADDYSSKGKVYIERVDSIKTSLKKMISPNK